MPERSIREQREGPRPQLGVRGRAQLSLSSAPPGPQETPWTWEVSGRSSLISVAPKLHLQSPADYSLQPTSTQSQVCFSDAARENTNIFRYLFSQSALEYFHPSLVLFLAPVLGFKMPHHDTAFLEGRTSVLKKWMWREWFPKQQ